MQEIASQFSWKFKGHFWEKKKKAILFHTGNWLGVGAEQGKWGI